MSSTATTWGSPSGPSVSAMSVGIDYSVSGTTATVKYYVRTEANSISDTQLLTYSGKITGSTSFSMTTPNMGAQLVATKTFSGSRGSSYTVGASLSGTYNGATPSHSRSIKIPATVPGQVAKPSISKITTVGATVTWSQPATNGASIVEYQIRFVNKDAGTVGSAASAGTSRTYTTTNRDSNTAYTAQVRARNSAGWGSWSPESSAFRTLPQAPTAPTGFDVDRVSDTTQKMVWTRTATKERPYTSQAVQRRIYANGAWGSWTTIATIGSDYTSSGSHTYNDTTTKANSAYTYRIQASNGSGNAYTSTSPTVCTTPASPTSVQASKNSAGNIVLTWVNNTVLSGGYITEIQHSTDGGSTWSALTSASTGVTTYTHSSPDIAVTHTYRVRTRISSSTAIGNGLASPFVVSNTVQLAAPPNPPTITGPTAPQNADNVIRLAWRHNPTDSSDQQQYRIAWRTPPGSASNYIGPITSDDEFYDVPAGTWNNGDTIEWQVQTWGAHASPSPYSAAAIITLSSPPSVAITTPEDGAVLADPRVVVAWEYYDPESTAQSGWEVELYDEGNALIESKSGSGATASVTLDTLVPDGSTWTVRVRVRDGAQMWSEWATSTFSLDYPEPLPPTVTPSWQSDTGSILVQVDNPDSGGTVTSVWDDTPLLAPRSTSTQTVSDDSRPPRTNLMVNPTAGMAGVPDVWNWRAEFGDSNVTVTAEVDGAGGTMGRMTALIAASPQTMLIPWAAVADINTDDSVYAVRLRLRALAEQTVTIEVILGDSATDTVGTWPDAGTSVGGTGDWQDVTFAVDLRTDVPPEAAYLCLSFTYADAQPVGTTLDVQQVLVEQAATAGDYFDGDTPAEVIDAPETVSNDIYRSIDGQQTWELVATGVGVDGEWVDHTAPVVGEVCYYAVAWSALPSAQAGPIECVYIYDGTQVCTDPDAENFAISAWISGDDGFVLVCRALAGLAINTSEVGVVDRTLHRFSGRIYPMEFSGLNLSEVIDLQCVVPKISPLRGEEVATRADWETLVRMRGPHLYRDYQGRRWLCSLSPAKFTDLGRGYWSMSLTITRTQTDVPTTAQPVEDLEVVFTG